MDGFLFLASFCFIRLAEADILECKVSTEGSEYRGVVNQTISGLPCQRWDSQDPHGQEYNRSELFPDRSLLYAANNCRNPNSRPLGPWCYTLNAYKPWEYCHVPACSAYPECKLTPDGDEYRGLTNTTRTGRACVPWQELCLDLPDNYCRNPDGKPDGPWCYVDSSTLENEDCDVHFCKPSAPCLTYASGVSYVGSVSTTQKGVPCQRWDTDAPHTSAYHEDEDFPDARVSQAEAYCRNPQGHRSRPWCYTMDPDVEWDYCNIQLCGECRRSELGSEYAGTVSQTISGLSCQRWDKQLPHPHSLTDPNRFPDASLADAEDFCRNPDGKSGGPWCHTTDAAVTWQHCDIPDCDANRVVPRIKHVLHIGIDGLHPCFMDANPMNIIDRLKAKGAWTLSQARTAVKTWSAACWTATMCSLGVADSGVEDNDWRPTWRGFTQETTPASGDDFPFPCVFDVLKRQNQGVRTAAFYTWEWWPNILSLGIPGSLDKDLYCDSDVNGGFLACDQFSTSNASEYLKQVVHSAESSYTFVYLVNVDETGHVYYWCSDIYLDAVKQADAMVGQLLDALNESGAENDVLVVLSTDHGGHDDTHGSTRDADLIVPLFFRGPGVKVNYELEFSAHTMDIVPTVIQGMGYTPNPWWTGTAIDQIWDTE